ncbi:DUF418 domain-containing protein [Streptomyces inhibens]|uniref:DUF418 domain-containing protein n=1 Tax=Streptomyces inhibens TaxID=2293571 RepID=UPI0037A03CAF
MTTTVPESPPVPVPVPRRRIDALDALRGFALCGILLVNIPQITHMRGYRVPGELLPVREALDLFVQHRFFPLFSFLFGLSFVLFYEGAAARAAKPRVLLLRRLVALAVLGVGHHFLQPGEALLPYAIVGLLILLPTARLSRRLVLIGGIVLTVAGTTLVSGGQAVIPGLFLLGAATARYGIADTLERRGGQLAVLLAVSAPAAVAAAFWQQDTWATSLGPRAASIAGLLMALAYACGFLLLLRTPLRGAMAAVFAPLGRMALTNYLTATLIIVAVAPVLGLSESTRWGTALGLAAVILAVQTVLSHLWLSAFRYGPLEWAWRCVTWWQLVPITKSQGRRGH